MTGPFSAPGFSFIRTDDIGNAAMTILVGPEGHVGLLLALVAVPIIWWLLGRTTWGSRSAPWARTRRPPATRA